MQTIEKTNEEKYQTMMDAVNKFYWDNSISPNVTAARLEEFAGEVSRLAQFIRANDPSLARAAELLRARRPDEQSETSIAATESGLYNCQVCGMEKCVQPGICDDCLSSPTENEIKEWDIA
jgi:hypothetical protein